VVGADADQIGVCRDLGRGDGRERGLGGQERRTEAHLRREPLDLEVIGGAQRAGEGLVSRRHDVEETHEGVGGVDRDRPRGHSPAGHVSSSA
jgi:hypothetical protein